MLVGRNEELRLLKQAARADESKFVAIYGRRRVGKTFLVREAFQYDIAFYHTGVANESKTTQLSEFLKNSYAYDVQSVVTMDDLFG